MMTLHSVALVRWFFGVSLLLLILGVGAALITYPAVVTTASCQQMLAYLLLFVLAVLIYGYVVLIRTHMATPAERIAVWQGAIWGFLCGGAWIVELIAANLVGPYFGWLNLVLYFGSAAGGYLLPGLAALLVAWRAGRIGAGLQAGLLCGMVGGMIIFLASAALAPLLLAAGQHDPQTMREFQRSGLPDLTTFIVGDYLAGMIAHLWIGMITGLVLGMLGGAIGKALAAHQRAILA
jgi:hypothetical protein